MIARIFHSRTQAPAIQWLIVILISLLLGLYILLTFEFPSKWFPLLFFAGIFPFVVLIVGNLRKLLLALILMDIPLQLDVSLGSSWVLNYTGAINGYIISLTTICLAGLYMLWMLEYLVNKRAEPQSVRRPNLYLTLYLAITCLSLFTAELRRVATFEIFLLVQVFFLYFYVINKTRNRSDVMFIVFFLLVGLTLESLIIILMQFVGQGFSFAGIMGNIYAGAATPDGVSRIGGTLISANTAGSYLSMLLAPTFAVLVTHISRPYKWLGVTAFTCGVLALLLTGSRGAWLSAVLSFVVFGIVGLRRGWLTINVMVVVVGVGTLVSILFFGLIYDRIFGDDAGAAAGRIPQYQVALQIIKANPLFGVGANNYPFIQRRYLTQNPDTEVFRWAVHNKYLLVWAETGFFALLTFVLFLLTTIRQGFKTSNVKGYPFSPLALGFSAAILGQMVHMFFDVFHSRPQVQLLWLISGLLMVLSTAQLSEGSNLVNLSVDQVNSR